MTNVSRRLNILCIMVKIIVFFIMMMFALSGLAFYSRVENTCMPVSFH